ncbi:helix-turn-helix domain-containing protein [Bifidobacterium subtile]|nr:helix-turn-helix domain-containing protein [Bifidobacterium subtile]
MRPIARRLGRSPSSISREIRRNTNPANGSYERRVLVIVAIPVLRCRRAAHQSSSRSMRLSSMRSHGTGTHRGEATCRSRAPWHSRGHGYSALRRMDYRRIAHHAWPHHSSSAEHG